MHLKKTFMCCVCIYWKCKVQSARNTCSFTDSSCVLLEKCVEWRLGIPSLLPYMCWVLSAEYSVEKYWVLCVEYCWVQSVTGKICWQPGTCLTAWLQRQELLSWEKYHFIVLLITSVQRWLVTSAPALLDVSSDCGECLPVQAALGLLETRWSREGWVPAGSGSTPTITE